MELLKQIWNGWKKVAHKIGNFQARIILLVFYFVILAPFSLIIKRADPMRLRKGANHGWEQSTTDSAPASEKMIRQW
jgi:hypothetical protein